MHNSSTSSSQTLERVALGLLWSQWTALGVSGNQPDQVNALLDPEALLLFSTVFARHDARLFDEILDWLNQNGAWINLLRMARLQREYALGSESVLGGMAEHLANRSALAKWKVLAKPRPRDRDAELLFPHLPPPARPDEAFRSRGWLRGAIELRGLSRSPPTGTPAVFLLRLRALFGIQSRAEVLAWLLTHAGGHPAQIARDTGYFRGSIQNVLNELTQSGLVFTARDGREKRFAVSHDSWRLLINGTSDETAAFPKWTPWALVFLVIQRLHELISEPLFWTKSSGVQSIEMTNAMGPVIKQLMVEGYAVQELLNAMKRASISEVVQEIERLTAFRRPGD